MNDRKQFLTRWKQDYDYKTMVSAAVSFAVTVVFALFNGFLGVAHRSLWHGTICVYYLILATLRGGIIAAERRLPARPDQAKNRGRVYLASSVLLLILNISLFVPISLMVRQQKPVSLTLIPAIAMAAYTTYIIPMASIHLKRRKRSADRLIRLLRTLNFIDALVSVLTLQNTLIMVNSSGGQLAMLPLTAITSGAVWLAVLLLSVSAIVRGVAGVRGRGR